MERRESKAELLQHYQISPKCQGTFFLKVDWILENAVFPLEQDMQENLRILWNENMEEDYQYPVLNYYLSNNYPPLQFLHEGRLTEFKSDWFLLECYVKNKMKSEIADGITEEMVLIRNCHTETAKFLFHNIHEKKKQLFDYIQKIFREYFSNGIIAENIIFFLDRIYHDKKESVYFKIQEMVDQRKKQEQIAAPKNRKREERLQFLKQFSIPKEKTSLFLTQLNVLLCLLAVIPNSRKYGDALRDTWKRLFPEYPYTDSVYNFIQASEKIYMNAYTISISELQAEPIINSLYRDSLILHTALKQNDPHTNPETLRSMLLQEIQGKMKWDDYFEKAFVRMQDGLELSILKLYASEIKKFWNKMEEKRTGITIPLSLQSHISVELTSKNGFQNQEKPKEFTEKNDVPQIGSSSKIFQEKNERIDALLKENQTLQTQLHSIQEQLETERNSIIHLLQMLDDKNYHHILGKMYCLAYTEESFSQEKIRLILQNFFEILNMNAICPYGTLGEDVPQKKLLEGLYRADYILSGDAMVKYPGYQYQNQTILKPVVDKKKEESECLSSELT